MVRRIGFIMWIGGAVIMFPLWMKLNPLALVFFVIALVGGGIVGWTESNKGWRK